MNLSYLECECETVYMCCKRPTSGEVAVGGWNVFQLMLLINNANGGRSLCVD
jgi:hypothetical protein